MDGVPGCMKCRVGRVGAYSEQKKVPCAKEERAGGSAEAGAVSGPEEGR